jgi:hypothetical protein
MGASRRITRHLDELCDRGGDCALPDHELLRQMECRHGSEDIDWCHELDRAVSSGRICREVINGETLIFPQHLREAELVVARLARQLAEGCFGKAGSPPLHKFEMVVGTNQGSIIDFVGHLLGGACSQNIAVTMLAPDPLGAKWLASKLSAPVLPLEQWLTSKELSNRDRQRSSSNNGLTECGFLFVFDSARIGLEQMAALLEAVPSGHGVLLIGDPTERTHGHGQPFADLIDSNIFHVTKISQPKACWGNPAPRAPVPRKRSALVWRLRRAASS